MNAVRYEYCFRKSTDANCVQWIDNGLSTSVPLAGLPKGTTYFWQVRAIDNNNAIAYSDEGNWWRFTTSPKQFAVNSTAEEDGYILESSENGNAGGTMNSTFSTLRLGDDVAKKQYRSILSFATGANLPDTAVITKVTLNLKHQGIAGGGNPVTMFQGFMADIKKGIFGVSALQLTDWQAAAGKTVGPFTTSPSGGWYTLNLTGAKAYVNKLATGGGLTQIRLRFKLDDNNNAIANYLSLYCGNAPVASRPQLIVEYYVP